MFNCDSLMNNMKTRIWRRRKILQKKKSEFLVHTIYTQLVFAVSKQRAILEGGILGRLRQFAIREWCHLSSDLHKHGFDAGLSRPCWKDLQFVVINYPIRLVNKRQVDTRDELHVWSSIRIRWPACDLETVNAILVHGMTWTDDGTIPVAHQDIIAVL